jgi:hypothetical protein
MKILLIGSEKEWAFENHYKKHLKNLGVFVDFFPAHDMFYDYYYKSIFNKIAFRLGLSRIYKKINQQLLNYLLLNEFDIVWVFKGMEITPKTLNEIKQMGPKLVNFNPDHPFTFSFKGSGNMNVLNSISCYDLHLCYGLAVKNKIKEEFNIKSIWLPFGFEKSKVLFPKEEEEIGRVCFIGNPDAYRTKILTILANEGIPLSVYGSQWENWIKCSPKADIKFHPPVYKESFNLIASKYRVQLNIFRPHNDNSHNMRTFEMTGLACVMLAPSSMEHKLLFKPGSEVLLYESIDDMKSKCNEILGWSYKKTLMVRKNVYKRSIESGYTYEARAIEVYKYFEELL